MHEDVWKKYAAEFWEGLEIDLVEGLCEILIAEGRFENE